MKTTTYKAMMAIAIAMMAMTANAATAPKGNTWRNTYTRIEVRHDNRHNRHYEVNWKNCRHNTLDRYGNDLYCHNCGAEMVWKGNARNGHYEAIAPKPANNHGAAPVTPNNKNNKNNGKNNKNDKNNKRR